jgi:hypothetical protein
MVIENFGLDVAWKEYGIAGKCIVCSGCMTVLLLLTITQSFIADLPQDRALLTLAPDLLHQLIKGVFKDHLVQWVEEYLLITHGKKRAEEILDDIDRRYVNFFHFY